MGGVLLHQLGGLVSVVELVGGAVGHPALGEDEDVVAALGAERIGVDSDGLQVDVAVVARGLAGGGTVKVPLQSGKNRARSAPRVQAGRIRVGCVWAVRTVGSSSGL